MKIETEITIFITLILPKYILIKLFRKNKYLNHLKNKFTLLNNYIIIYMSATLITSLGEIKIELFCELVPRTAKNFLALAASNKYDNTIFHRNIPGFIIQGGEKSASGKGTGQSICIKCCNKLITYKLFIKNANYYFS